VPYGLDGEPTDFPEHNGQITLVCAAFRQGAQPMIDAWSKAFDEKFRDQDKAVVVEISLVDSFIMSLWPFRSTLLAQAAKSEQKYSINSNFLFLFKDVDFFQRKLELPNRLVGYVFLLDTENLIRWKGCGFPEKSELDSLLSCADTLIQQEAASSA
jgi:ATPase complex subunit ATP10